MMELESRRPVAAIDAARMVQVLAGYLLACPWFRCPGVDGASTADVVANEYPAASAAGWVPRPPELAVRHPELADTLASFFRTGTPMAGVGHAGPRL